MFLLIIGLILLIIGFSIPRNNPSAAKATTPLKFIGTLIIIIGIFTSTIKQIDAGEVGVQSLFGKVQTDVLESGLHLVNPMVDIITFDTKTQNYTMSSIHDESNQVGDDAIRVLTADGLQVVVDLTVLYRVIPTRAPSILREIGSDYRSKIVRPIIRTKIRDNSAYYDAVSLYSTKRDEFQDRIFKTIDADFKSRGLVLEQLLVRNIDLPASVKQAIESKINAEQESQKMQFVLAKERQEADRKRVEAQGIADYQKILSTGLSDKQLQYEMIKAQKEIATSPNAKVIIMNGRGNTPILIGDK